MPYPIIDALIGDMVMYDGQLLNRADSAAASLFQPSDVKMVYEVIRLVHGIPLFWTDHLQRLAASAAEQLTIPEGLADQAARLLHANLASREAAADQAELRQANLRIVVWPEGSVLHLTPGYYPTEAMIQSGVPTGTLRWEREDPNIKRISPQYKAAVAAGFRRKGPWGSFFELLLEDRQGKLTEGSRSNLFVLAGTDIFSAPDDRILLGITRRHVRAAIADAGLNLHQRLFSLAELSSASKLSAFLSGSPIDLLPICSIEHYRLQLTRQGGFDRLRQAYLSIAAADLERSRNLFN